MVQGKSSCTGKAVCVGVYVWVRTCGGKSVEEDFLELVFFLYLGSVLGAEFRLLCSLISKRFLLPSHLSFLNKKGR